MMPSAAFREHGYGKKSIGFITEMRKMQAAMLLRIFFKEYGENAEKITEILDV